MKRNIITKAWLLLFLLSGAMPTLAQSSGDGYNPTNPSDPGDPDKLLKYGIEAVANISGAGTVTGSGTYKYGTSVTVKTTTNTGYKFLYWTKDEAEDNYKTATSFTHTVECNVKFTAVFEKLKTITAQSNYSQITKPTVTGGASGYFSKGTTAKLTAATKADYQFKGWQRNGEEGLCSTQNPYTITVGDNDEVYTAVYDYVPGNPADPSDVAGNVFYNVTVSTNEPGWGIVAGAGKYKKGTQVSISTSPTAGYALQSWTKRTADGDVENFATTRSFTYTMDTEDVEFIAVYYNIAENLEANGHSVNLVASEPGTCTFSIANGQKYLEGDAFTVTVTTGTDVNFEGWYINGIKVADTKTYGSYMGAEDITLEARCHYNPYNPADPMYDQDFLDFLNSIGDMNEDGIIDVTDAIAIICAYINNEETNKSIADVNGDKTIDVSDAIAIIDKYLNTKYVLIEQILLSNDILELKKGEESSLSAQIFPIDASSKSVVWSSSDESVATVSNKGVVTAIAEGTSYIYCTAKDGSETFASCEVIVIPDNIDYTNIDLSKFEKMTAPASGTSYATPICFSKMLLSQFSSSSSNCYANIHNQPTRNPSYLIDFTTYKQSSSFRYNTTNTWYDIYNKVNMNSAIGTQVTFTFKEFTLVVTKTDKGILFEYSIPMYILSMQSNFGYANCYLQ